MTCRCASSRPCLRSTTTASARWRARCRAPWAAACAARPSRCSASPSSPKPMTCARRRELPDIEYSDDPYACARGADALVIVTEWVQFRALDLERLKREMAQPVVVDLRNIYRPEDMAALGFIYESVGRPSEPRK